MHSLILSALRAKCLLIGHGSLGSNSEANQPHSRANEKSRFILKICLKIKSIDLIPSSFIKHIKGLGFKEDNAGLLYDNKDQWIGMKSDGIIYCTEAACKHETIIDQNCLRQHCFDKHKWGSYPCSKANCKFISYSKVFIVFF